MSLRLQTCNSTTWDDSQSLRFLHNISQLVRQEKNSPNFAMKNLGVLSKTFYDQAIDPHYQCHLAGDQNLELETLFVNLADWIQCGKREGSKQQQQITIKLQICLLQIVRFILTKTSNDLRDLYWARNAVQLSLETAIYCYDAQRWQEMSWCMSEADFYQNRFTEKWKNIPLQLWAPFLLDNSLLSVLRLLWMHRCMIDDDEAFTCQFAILDSCELSAQQSTVITRMCFNVGLEQFNRGNYKPAVFWLKYSHHYGQLSNIGKRGRKTSGKALFLLAVCLFKWNAVKYRNRIFHVLNCTGASETLAVAELGFRTLLLGKSDLSHLVQSALKLFGIYAHQESAKLRENLLRVFNELEKNEKFEAIVELLNTILWHNERKTTIYQDLVPHIRWICAEVAIKTCIKRNFQSGCYLWLQEMANWTSSEHVNFESLNHVLAVAQLEAIKMKSTYLSLKWFRTLVQITRLHGGRSSLIKDAVRFSLSLNSAEGYFSAKEFLNDETQHIEFDMQLIRFKLLIAVLDGDVVKANKAWSQLDSQYKKSIDLESEGWKEAINTLEICTVAALKNSSQMTEVATNCLNAIMQEISNHSSQSSLLVRVIRFHMKVLFKLAGDNPKVQAACVENLIAALISAYLSLQENMASSSGQHDCGGLELWFGNLAWSLGRKFDYAPAFHRHQFFKISYKFLSLTAEKDKDVNERIEMAIILSVAAGINAHSHRNYRQVLKSCLDICAEMKDKQKTTQLNFYEFYILCEQGETKRLLELFRHFQSNDQYSDNANFFEGLAVLASSANQSFLRLIMPPTECQQLPLKENSQHQQREQKLQLKLTDLAIQCLMVANRIHIRNGRPLPIEQLVMNWKRIIHFSFEIAFLQENTMESHLTLCEEYRRFIGEYLDHIDSMEVVMFFNHVWNVTAEIKIFKGLKEAERWIELIKNVASFSLELQKLFRSLQKDLQNKFTGAWD